LNTGGASTLVIKNVNVADSSFDSPDSLIQTKKFTYRGLAQFTIQNSLFSNLTFLKFGNVMYFTHNSITPVIIQSVTF